MYNKLISNIMLIMLIIMKSQDGGPLEYMVISLKMNAITR